MAVARAVLLEISPPVLHAINNERWRRDDRTEEKVKESVCHPDSTSPTLRHRPKVGGISTCTKQRNGTGKKSPLGHGSVPAATKGQLCPTPDPLHVAVARAVPLEISPPLLHAINNERWRRDDGTEARVGPCKDQGTTVRCTWLPHAPRTCHPDSTSRTLRHGPKVGGISTCTKQRNGTGKKLPLGHGSVLAKAKGQLCPTPGPLHVAVARAVQLEISPPLLHAINNERWRRDDGTEEKSKRKCLSSRQHQSNSKARGACHPDSTNPTLRHGVPVIPTAPIQL